MLLKRFASIAHILLAFRETGIVSFEHRASPAEAYSPFWKAITTSQKPSKNTQIEYGHRYISNEHRTE